MEINFNLPIMAKIKENNDNKLYEVEYISMGQSHTSVKFKKEDSLYNSIKLKFYLWDREIDIFKSVACNTYLRVNDKLISYMDDDNED